MKIFRIGRFRIIQIVHSGDNLNFFGLRMVTLKSPMHSSSEESFSTVKCLYFQYFSYISFIVFVRLDSDPSSDPSLKKSELFKEQM